MLQLQKPMDSRLALRLMHDLSPESDDSSSDDEETLAVQRETFILSCLAQSTINNNNNNSINHVSQTTCPRSRGCQDTITETYAKLELKQHHFEQINNQINEQHLYKMLEKPCQNINQLNNNFLKSCNYEEESSDKENVKPCPTGSSGGSERVARRPRKLPDVPRKSSQGTSAQPKPRVVHNEKCLADELQEALTRPNVDTQNLDDEDYFQSSTTTNRQMVYPKYSGKYLEELKQVKFNSVSKNTRAYLKTDNMYLKEDSSEQDNSCDVQTTVKPRDADACSGTGGDEGGDDSRRTSSCFPGKNYQELVVTHRGMHRFIPRHKDELAIEIGDPIHVVRTDDDLWCEGINLRSNQRGIFPSMYATDLAFLEEEEEENGCSKFFLRFLGSVEVNYHKGDEVLCQAINKVALSRRAVKTSLPPPVCNLEISQYGIRMLDKSTTGHDDTESFTHFFALKNITFCGHHPRNERYFGFITKHPNQYRYACHVFLGEKSTRSVTDSMGQAFKRFYQEYMAFTHPTEDIYME